MVHRRGPTDALIASMTTRHPAMAGRRAVVVLHSQVRSTSRAVARPVREKVRSDALEKAAGRQVGR